VGTVGGQAVKAIQGNTATAVTEISVAEVEGAY